jgi:hypothetical protein
MFGGDGYSSDSVKTSPTNILWQYNPETNQWAWMGGSPDENHPGHYGELGVADPANVPGARSHANHWKGSDGNFWLLGGQGLTNTTNSTSFRYSDLWRFEPESGNWTWMHGSMDPNEPPVYGVRGIEDPANTPGSRLHAQTWSDAQGGLWLFGGRSSATFNDLWRFDIASGQWTWIAGEPNSTTSGSYQVPIEGLETRFNYPGSRYGGVAWSDDRNRAWMFGGLGYDAGNIYTSLNDAWRGEFVGNAAEQWSLYR